MSRVGGHTDSVLLSEIGTTNGSENGGGLFGSDVGESNELQA